ncbi:AAA family ATPase [Georgenia sp. SUBG003]|uniref:AAA family ATPase n=1 Tax=Georgenia sp. SUBG003 TaxID=1497974 RepID=UPI003AB6956A
MDSPPWVVVLTGAPGSGKSSTARELARLLGAALLDQDSMTNPLVDIVGELIGVRDYDDVRLAGLVRTARYASLLSVAGDCVAAGVPAVLVAPFTTERRDSDAWADLSTAIADFGGRACMVWLRITANELSARLQARAAERDEGKLKDITAFVKSLDLGAVVPHLEVPASLPPAGQATLILGALR